MSLASRFRALADMIDHIEGRDSVDVEDASVLQEQSDPGELRAVLELTAELSSAPVSQPESSAESAVSQAQSADETPEDTSSESENGTGTEPADPEIDLGVVVEETTGLGDFAMQNLRDIGIETVTDIRAATAEELAEAGRVGPKTAARLKDQAEAFDRERHEDDDGGQSFTDLEERVIDVLDERGELTSSEIQTLTDSSQHVFNIIDQLQTAGHVVARQDPRDRRRNLYRLDGADLTVTADSEVPGEQDESDDAEESAGDADDEADPSTGVTTAAESNSTSGSSSQAEGEGEGEGEGEDTNSGTDSEKSYPRECGCGETCAGTLEYHVHRLEEHGDTSAELDFLEPGAFESIVADAESVGEVIEACSWSRERTLRLLGIYGLSDVVGGSTDISDINAVEFEGVGSKNDSTATDDGDEQVATADGGQSPPSQRIDLDQFGVGRSDLIEAITGAQTIHQIRRELHHLSRDDIVELLDTLGYLDQFQSGRPSVDHRAVKQRIAEVSA